MSKQLKAAIEQNDPEAVRATLKPVKDINRKMPGSKSPLLYACERGADRVLEILFEGGAIAQKRHTVPWETPFAVAAEFNQFTVMKRLVDLKQATDEVVEHILHDSCMKGKGELLDFTLKLTKKPVTIGMFRLGFAAPNAPEIIRVLLSNGWEINSRYDKGNEKNMTVLHEAAGKEKPELSRTLVECGADVNARDDLGRTPLMCLGATLDRLNSGSSAVTSLLLLGADASLRDLAGNDAIDYCELEIMRFKFKPRPEAITVLRQAGAKGSEATLNLFKAIAEKNLEAVRAAIAEGADVNRLAPPPVPRTPLTCAADWSLEIVDLLLRAGADPNRMDTCKTPLICAARSGEMQIVKRLLETGADVHKTIQSGEYIENAYSAADTNQKYGVVDYLKSLGARMPRPDTYEPLKPGVESWNDFDELLAKTSAKKAADALAKIIRGQAHMNAYGKSFAPGERAFVVVQVKGMNWSNVLQLTPPIGRYESPHPFAILAPDLAKTAAASVLFIQYSDTSDAASVLRIEPNGNQTEDAGWDYDSLKEITENLGKQAPAGLKRKLTKTDANGPTSTERLVKLAQSERFIVAAFGLYCEPGRKITIEFSGCHPEVFEHVAFISS